MNEVLNYICGELSESKACFKSIAKAFKRQDKFNSWVFAEFGLACIYFLLNERRAKAMEKEFNELKSEVAELKNPEGE